MQSKAAEWPRGGRQPHAGAPDGVTVLLPQPTVNAARARGAGGFPADTAVHARAAPGGRGQAALLPPSREQERGQTWGSGEWHTCLSRANLRKQSQIT